MASTELWSLRSALMDVLNDLIDSDLESFKFYIQDKEVFKEFSIIRRHQLQSTERPKILTAILDHYGIFTIDIVKTVLEMMNENTLRNELCKRCLYKPQEILLRCQEKMVSALRASSCGGNKFNKGYTAILIIVGGSGHVYKEYKVMQLERDSRSSNQENTILFQDLFKDQNAKKIRVVLTKGRAGVGKTFLTQKFIQDWAERKTNKEDIQLLFHLSFRNLNEKRDSYSLEELLHTCFSETKELFSFQQLKLLFILDGLEECGFPLEFEQFRVISAPTERASVGELLVNLIRGDLLPSAHVWITTRPESALHIPDKHVSMVTEVRGFTDQQKDLLHQCLNKLNDQSLLEEIHKILQWGGPAGGDMSPADWSALSFILQSSGLDLEEFDLSKFQNSENALLGLLQVLKASTKAILCSCFLNQNICTPLASVLISSSSLKHLDLNNNDLQDSGVELLCEGLKSDSCRLNTLRLSGCLVSERGGNYLAAALSNCQSRTGSTPWTLTELDLSYNHLGPSADLLRKLQDPPGRLKRLSLDPGGQKFLIPGLRKYACEVLLDPNTVHSYLHLSHDLLSVMSTGEKQSYPDHQDRFTYWLQVLSSSSLKGRCYWEADWSDDSGVVICAVSYKRICRTGHKSGFGYQDHSWCLMMERGHCLVRHNNQATKLPGKVGRSSGRVGVYLDWECGVLSFYDVSNGGRSHLYTFKTTFTEELLPGFELEAFGGAVSVVQLNQD